jgi:glycine cleavage system aminomethyltransferase T
MHHVRTMQVELQDIASRTAMLTLAGPNAHEVLAALGAEQAADLQPGQHMMLQAESSPTVVAATRTLGGKDFTLIADEAMAGKLWKSLTAKV